MYTFLIKRLTIALLIVVLVSCSGGAPDGSVAGIGGSGYISSGQVTGFGSVYVNGVKFETDSAIFNVESVAATQQELRIGMIVQVAGIINADGVTGTASAIRYGDNIEGFVEPMPGENKIIKNEANTEKSFRVMGINVIVDVVKTTFEGDDFDYTSIDLDNVVEISGYYDNNAVLRATYIELKADKYDTDTQVEIEGNINGHKGTRFNVLGVDVNYSRARHSGLTIDLQNDLYVEVKGIYDNDSSTLFASDVKVVDVALSDNTQVSVEGFVTRYVSNGDFDINAYPVNASAALLEPVALIIRPGLKLKIEGRIKNGVLNAEFIEFDEGEAKVKAFIDSIDIVNHQFSVEVVAGEPSVVIQLSDITIIENVTGEVELISLSELNVGDYVEVNGFEADTDTINAVLIKRKLASNIKLQGVLREQDENVSVTVLDVKFPVSSGFTEYEGFMEGEDFVNHGAFILETSIDKTVISIEDEANNGFGVADEVEIKKP